MRDRFLAAWRTALQTFLALVVALLAHWGLHLSPAVSGVVLAAGLSIGAGIWAAVTHWLLSQTGPGLAATALRWIGQILTLSPAQVASYAPVKAAPPQGQ